MVEKVLNNAIEEKMNTDIAIDWLTIDYTKRALFTLVWVFLQYIH